MRLWDSFSGDRGRPGPVMVATVLAGVLLSLPPVTQPITRAYSDFLQRIQAEPADSHVVVVDTSELAGGEQPFWRSPRYPDLLRRLRLLNARLVVEATPRTGAGSQPSLAELAELAAAEARSRQAGGNSVSETLVAELAAMRRQAELDQRVADGMASMRNVIVTVPVFDVTGTPATTTACAKHLMDTGPAGTSIAVRRIRGVSGLPPGMCRSSLTAGHVEFWPDEDGVVRRLDLLVDAGGKVVPSVALRAVMAVTNPGGGPAAFEGLGINWADRKVETESDGTMRLRFSDHGEPIASLRAGSLLGNDPQAAASIRGRIVVLGSTAGQDGIVPLYRTPTGDGVAPAFLLATAIDNLLDDDYIRRPSWLGWAEGMLFVTIAGLLITWLARIPEAIAVMTGLCLAVVLLAVEAYFVLGHGLALELSNIAVFVVATMCIGPLLRDSELMRRSTGTANSNAPVTARRAALSMTPAPADGLEEEFSRLRHEQATEPTKARLYDIALEHARQKDLAKAERVLRHLAGIDPDYRNAREKLRKLTGLRSAPAEPQETRGEPPLLRPQAEISDLSGQTIGRYRIETVIGRGAMATVYLGRDPRINRRVAIKTIALAEEFSDSDLVNARTQFLREAESAGRLNHPNIISIYDAGEDGSVAYLAMEYFQGKPLSHYAQQGHLLPPAIVFELMARAAEALHYAHGQHVVHRDIKPANLMYDRSTDSLKITDFGIARLTDTSKTKTGIILGTPSYMSPEQLAGGAVTGQSDLFSLGITLYQLLTGTAPFRADSIPKLMQKIAHERHESVRLVREDLPRSVDMLLDQALAKDPADRFPSGRSMAVALRECGRSPGTAAAS